MRGQRSRRGSKWRIRTARPICSPVGNARTPVSSTTALFDRPRTRSIGTVPGTTSSGAAARTGCRSWCTASAGSGSSGKAHCSLLDYCSLLDDRPRGPVVRSTADVADGSSDRGLGRDLAGHPERGHRGRGRLGGPFGDRHEERAPAITAHTAIERITGSPCRRPEVFGDRAPDAARPAAPPAFRDLGEFVLVEFVNDGVRGDDDIVHGPS